MLARTSHFLLPVLVVFGLFAIRSSAGPDTVPFAGSWTGEWKNSVGEQGKDSLDLTEDADGKLSGTWSGDVSVTGKRTGPNSFELQGKTKTRSYALTGAVHDGVLTLKYVATRLNAEGTYSGESRFEWEKTKKSPAGFTPLFNGKDLSGWKVNTGAMDAWEVWPGGVLRAEGRARNWLLTEAEYDDFELRLEYRLFEKGNSGVALRSPANGDPAFAGMEVQLLDDASYPGQRATGYTGAIYGVAPPTRAAATKPFGEWNDLHITAQGRRVSVTLNGTLMLSTNLDEHKASAEKHPGILRKRGHIGLQQWGTPVEFRNVFVKRLTASAAGSANVAAAGRTITLTFTHGTDRRVVFGLRGRQVIEHSLEPGQTDSYTLVVDPAATPRVRIRQEASDDKVFTISDRGEYVFQVRDGQIINTSTAGTPLFNNKDLTGWRPHNCSAADWSVRGNVLHTTGKGKHDQWLLTEEEYDHFDLRLEFRLSKGGNSGIALRAPREGNPAYTGMELQLLDDSSYKGLRANQRTGTIYDVIPRWGEHNRPPGEWNRLRVVLQGRRLSVEVNDIRVIDNANLDAYRHLAGKVAGLQREKGHIGLQTHTGTAEFRSIWLKKLPASGGTTELPQVVLDSGGHTGPVQDIAFSPDGKYLYSASDDKTVRVWDVARGMQVKVIRPPIREGVVGKLYAVAVSPDGRLLATAGWDAFLYLINLNTGRLERVLRGHNGTIHSLAFSPDSTLVVSGSHDHTAVAWETTTGKLVRVFRGHTGQVSGLAFSPDGRQLATASRDGTARAWTVDDGSHLATLGGHTQGLSGIAWSSDGKTIATACLDGTVRLWDPQGKHLRTCHTEGDQNRFCRGVAFTADSREVVTTWRIGSGTGAPVGLIFGVTDGKERARLQGSHNDLHCVAVSPDGKLAATGGFNAEDLRLWRVSDGAQLFQLRGQGSGKWAAAWGPTGRVIGWGNSPYRDRGLFMNDMGPIQRAFDFNELQLTEPTDGFLRRKTSHQGLSLSRERDGGAKVLVRRNGETQTTIDTTRHGGARHAVILNEQRVVVGANFGHLNVFDAQAGSHVRSWRGHMATVWGLEPSPDERYVLTASHDETLRLWEVNRSDPVLSLFVAGNDWVAWTPEGYYAASPGGEQLIGWHVNNGPDEMPTYYPAAQFRKTLYRPDVIKCLLDAGSLAKALADANQKRGRSTPTTAVAQVLPPRVRITAPARAGERLTTSQLEVRASAHSLEFGHGY